MNYKEYKASEGKILLNLKDFSYGNTILCSNDTNLSLIEVTKEDAEYFYNKYRKASEELNEQIAYEDYLERQQPQETRARSVLRAMPEPCDCEDPFEDRIKPTRLELIQEIMDLGYNLNSVTELDKTDLGSEIKDLLSR